MDKQMKILVGAFGLLVVLLLYFGLRSRTTSDTASTTPGPAADPAMKELLHDAGLVRVPFDPKRLRIALQPRPGCDPGDGDVIRLDTQSGGRLLLTVESPVADDVSFKPIVREVPASIVEKAQTIELSLPPLPRPRQLAVYLCLDNENAGRCSGKLVDSVNRVFRESTEQKEQYKPKDRIYVFHYTFVDGDNLLLMRDGIPVDERFSRVFQYVARRPELALSRAQVERELEATKERMGKIQSLPLNDGKTTELVIPLPRYDVKACTGDSTRTVTVRVPTPIVMPHMKAAVPDRP